MSGETVFIASRNAQRNADFESPVVGRKIDICQMLHDVQRPAIGVEKVSFVVHGDDVGLSGLDAIECVVSEAVRKHGSCISPGVGK